MKYSEMEHLIASAIKDFDGDFNKEYGEVVSIADGLAMVCGLAKVSIGEMVQFSSGCKGLVISLDVDFVSTLICGDMEDIKTGDIVTRTNEFFSVRVSEQMLGRVLNGYGEAIDDEEPILDGEMMLVEREAPGLLDRQEIKEQVVTGIKVVDWITPVGTGQRQLLLGARSTGKTSALQTIMVHHKDDEDYISVYVSIGQQIGSAVRTINDLKLMGVNNAIHILANASSEPAMLYLAPYVGVSIAEYFMQKGKKALVFFDNLNVHANAYRQISLSLRRPPGREAYPGDIFYLHSRLLERAGKLNDSLGGGSMTIFPIVETLESDFWIYSN